MGRTDAVIPLLGRLGHAEARRWPLTRPVATARETRMKLPNWVRLPGRTVRVRLTALYGVLFLFSGALLLAIASGVAVSSSSVAVASSQRRAATAARPGQRPIHALQAQVISLQSQVASLQSQLASQPSQTSLAISWSSRR